MRRSDPIAKPADPPEARPQQATAEILQRTARAPTVLAFEDQKPDASPVVPGVALTVAVPVGYLAIDQLSSRLQGFSNQVGAPVELVTYRSTGQVLLVDQTSDDPLSTLLPESTLASDLQGADVIVTEGPATVHRLRALDLIASPSPAQQARLFHRHDRLWLDPVIDESTIMAAPIGAVIKGAIWYRPRLFEGLGYKVPEKWAEMVQLTRTMRQDGVQPWCFSIGQAGETGANVSDWMEASLLAELGPSDYGRWLTHSIPANDPRAGVAAERILEILGDPENFGGGSSGTGGAMTASQSSMVDRLLSGGCLMFRADSTLASELTEAQLSELSWFLSRHANSATGEAGSPSVAPMLVNAHYAAVLHRRSGVSGGTRLAAEVLLDYLSRDHDLVLDQGGLFPVNPPPSPTSSDATIAAAMAGLRNPEQLGFDASEVLRFPGKEDLLAELSLQFFVRGGDAMRVFDRLETGWEQRSD